jgi:5-methyltetrahydrofolate--homocysteine methyltransferase
VLNYVPSRSGGDAATDETGMPPLAPAAELPSSANDAEVLASHPQGCTCALHLAWRKQKVAVK